MSFRRLCPATADLVALHAVNYALRMDANTVDLPGEVTVDVPLPPGRRTPYASCRLITLDGVRELALPAYDFERTAATVRFSLDRAYGIVLLADDEPAARRAAEIEGRREEIRRMIRSARSGRSAAP